jgi:hypothetical protein
MSNKQNPSSNQEGEISDQQLDSVSGGQQVVKMEKITITATRLTPQQGAKTDKPVVTAQKDKAGISGTQVASAEGAGKKN